MIVWLGILSIAAAVMVFIVVMGVLEGFSEQLYDMVRRTTSHVDISRPYVGGLADWKTVAEIASRHPEVLGTTPYVQGPALMQSQRYRFYGFIKGVDWQKEKEFGHITGYIRIPLSEAEISGAAGLPLKTVTSALAWLIERKFVEETEDYAGNPLYLRSSDNPKIGNADAKRVFEVLKAPPDKIVPLDENALPGVPAIIVGDRIWTEMDLRRGEVLKVSVQAGEEGNMLKSAFTVMGEFKTGSQLFDHWALTNLSDAQALFAMNSNVHGIGVWLKNYRDSGLVARDLRELFDDPSVLGLGGIEGFEPSPKVLALIGKKPLPVIGIGERP